MNIEDKAKEYLAKHGYETDIPNAVDAANQLAFELEVSRREGAMVYFDGDCEDICRWNTWSDCCECGKCRVCWVAGFTHSFEYPYISAVAYE